MVISLPIFQSNSKDFLLFQNSWQAQLNPLLNNPLVDGIFLKAIQLNSGKNVINHLLGRVQQGWIITDINASSVIYRSAPFNSQTLTLMSGGTAVVNIYVF